jgi:hypothetical protein
MIRTPRINPIILIGANVEVSGYPLIATLEALSGYKRFNLFYFEFVEKFSQGETKFYPNGYVGSENDFYRNFKIFTPWQQIGNDFADVLVDVQGNKFNEVQNCTFHWIKPADTSFNILPSSVADRNDKFLKIGLSIKTEKVTGMYRLVGECIGKL